MRQAEMIRRLLKFGVVGSLNISKSNFARMASKSALILLIEGNEEMETVIPTDTLRRAGINVTLAGVDGAGAVNCSRNVKIVPDTDLESAVKKGPYDVVILPGGLGGAKAFCQSAAVGAVLKEQEKAGRKIAAICASPTALQTHGVGIGKKITSHPLVEQELLEKYTYLKDRVVIDGEIITSQGPGTAFEFSITIVEQLLGKEEAEKLAAFMLLKL